MSENGNSLDSEIKDLRNDNGGNQSDLPNAVATLVLGIISIVGCFLYAIPGLICGIIAISLHGKDRKLHKANPGKYDNSFKTANAGYICAIIGTSLSALYFLFWIIVFAGVMSSPAAFR